MHSLLTLLRVVGQDDSRSIPFDAVSITFIADILEL